MKPILFLCFPLLLGGCSAFRSHTQEVAFRCDQADTFVQVDGVPHRMPATLELPRDRAHLIVVERPGFRPVRTTIDRRLNGTGVLDIVGTFLWLVPAIGLLSPGAWSLDQEVVTVQMIPEPKP